MSTVARSKQKQALVGELAEARALLARGEFEKALVRLAGVRERAREEGNAEALREISELARGLWWRAPRGSEVAERADRLSQAARQDLGSQRQASTRPSHPPPATSSHWLRNWSLVVVIAWLIVSLMVGTAATETEYFSRSFLIVLALLAGGGIAAAVWVVGTLILWGLRMSRWDER